MKDIDKQLLARLDDLMRKDLISAQMATSLINDSGYAYRGDQEPGKDGRGAVLLRRLGDPFRRTQSRAGRG